MNNLPKRKNIRLENYDYSKNGVYFITICTHNRKSILSTVGAIHESPENCLTPYGEIVDKIIKTLPYRFNIDIDKYVIMPNHIHILVRIYDERAIRESPLRSRSVISNVIGYLKMNASKQIHLTYKCDVWQRSFYNHIIRNDNDYKEKWEYIDTNVLRWADDEFYIKSE